MFLNLIHILNASESNLTNFCQKCEKTPPEFPPPRALILLLIDRVGLNACAKLGGPPFLKTNDDDYKNCRKIIYLAYDGRLKKSVLN